MQANAGQLNTMKRSCGRVALKWIWVAVLVGATGTLAWLWVAAQSDHPKRLYRSTDRTCSWVGFDQAAFVFSYDGGKDIRTFRSRSFELLGVFCNSGSGMGGWQHFKCGIHGGYASAWLGLAWASTSWFLVFRPMVRRRRGRCVICGYSLAGVRDARCPECGSVWKQASCASASAPACASARASGASPLSVITPPDAPH